MGDICRVCLSSSGMLESKNMFNNFYENQSYAQIYEYCIGHPVTTKDNCVPSRLCNNCEESLCKSYDFKSLCLRAEVYLKSHFDNNENNILEETYCEFLDYPTITTNKEDPLNEKEFADEYYEIKQQDSHSEEDVDYVIQNDIEVRKLDLETSEDTHEGINNKKETAHLVTLSTHRPEKLNRKSKNSVPKRDTKIVCPICGRLLEKRGLPGHLLRHEDPQNNNLRRYKCDNCEQSFLTSRGLKNHKQIHLRPKEKHISCNLCGTKYASLDSKRSHDRYFHILSDSFKCTICSASYSSMPYLKRHMVKHTGERSGKTYECTYPECEKTYSSKSNLTEHLAVHEEKKFDCSLCDRTYLNIGSLRRHVDHFHKNIRNYICPVCKKGFFQNPLLRNHMVREHPDHELPPKGTYLSKKFLEKDKQRGKLK